MNWKKQVIQVMWLIAGVGTIVLLGAAMKQKDHRVCHAIKVEIVGAEEHLFIDENDIQQLLNVNAGITDKPMGDISMKSLEALLEKNPWVANAELFFDNQQVLQVKVDERQPIARVFTVQGNSFYLDSGGLRLPLSEKISARVPMFTGFPSDKEILSTPDSLLLRNVIILGKQIIADSFWMAQTAQVVITPTATFELMSTIGDQTIVIGDIDDLDAKFKRLNAFYTKAWVQNGINTYERIDVRYNKQVVAVRRGTSKAIADSMLAKQMLQQILPMASNDSVQVQVPLAIAPKKIIKKDSVTVIKPPLKPITKPAVASATKKKLPATPQKNNKKKTNPLSVVNVSKQPKAVMHRP